MKIDVQKFMEIRESARTRQGAATKAIADKTDWRALLESKRKEIGLESAAPTAAKVSPAKAENKNRAVALDFEG